MGSTGHRSRLEQMMSMNNKYQVWKDSIHVFCMSTVLTLQLRHCKANICNICYIQHYIMGKSKESILLLLHKNNDMG